MREMRANLGFAMRNVELEMARTRGDVLVEVEGNGVRCWL